MEHLKCNQLACRSVLRETAVVTTCSHCFCVTCANGLFRNAHVCPACSASLTEPDDIVVCSLQPTNDYKTSVLSGLSPGIILQICERAMSFWEYQSRQESAFQQAVLKSVNDKSAQVQKQLDSVIREANSELALVNDKIRGLERDIELERRKNREQQEQLRERDKEYARLKSQYDQLKRKALLAPEALSAAATETANEGLNMRREEPSGPRQVTAGLAGFASLSVNDVVNNMEVGGLQRTPLRAYANNSNAGWQPQGHATFKSVRPQGNAQGSHRFQMENVNNGSSNNTQSRGGANVTGHGGGGLPPRRAGSGSRTPDSPRGSENSGGEAERKVPGRNQVDPNAGVGSSRLQVNRPAQRGFSFGQTTMQRAASSSTAYEQRKPGTFRPAGFPR